MSDHQPGPDAHAEYLDSGSGAAVSPARTSAPNRKRIALVAAGLGLIALLGAGGTWAYLAFTQQGPQPAEALPASTVFYLSVDLDPSGGQKVAAIETLRKFP